MKKNFLKIAALLIAAMLLVVSCSQEVAPKNEDNGLVKATIGVAYGKDVTVVYGDDADITYKYKLEPLWNNLENGAPIYGATKGEVSAYNTTYKLSGDPAPGEFTANYVTPGYWQITVNGYVGQNENEKLVLTGSTKTYINKTTSNATVFVSPISDPNTNAVGNVTITLLMEDLDADDADDSKASKIKYYLDGSATGVPVTKIATDNTSENNSAYVNANEAHEYRITLNTVAAGYHTITIKVDGYTGGVTKSFLMIPGNDVTISGSIYPSKFEEAKSDITVVTLNPVVLKINDTEFANANVEPVKLTGQTFTATMADFNVTSGLTGTFNYTWYIDGKKQTVTNTTSNVATLKIPSDPADDTVKPGDYTVTCVATLTTQDAEGTHVHYGGEKFAGKIRVEASGNKYHQ